MKKSAYWSLLLVLVLAWPQPAWAKRRHHRPAEVTRPFSQAERETLVKLLAADGLPKPYLEEVFGDTRLKKLERVIDLNVMNQEGNGRQYRQFWSDSAIRRARGFMARQWTDLSRAESQFGVPAETIVAVLLVETQLGHFPMRHRPLEVFATLALETQTASVDEHMTRLQRRHPEVQRDYVAERLAKKASWAHEELRALLNMKSHAGKPLYELKGSYAGALGLPQFLPSSYLQWGADGDNDGVVNLENWADAMASIGNYLKAHGWEAWADEAAQRQAVWSYNHSGNYVEAVFQVSRRLAPYRNQAATPQSLSANRS